MTTDARFPMLLARYFDEALTVDEATEFNGMLSASADARESFWREARIHSRLRQWGEQCAGVAPLTRDLPPEPFAKTVTERKKQQDRPRRKWFGVRNSPVLQVTALLMLIGVGAFVWLGQSAPDKTDPPHDVARFVAVEDAYWVRADERHLAGETIRQGQRIELSSGATQIEFDSGATVLLLGPAIFDVTSDNSAFLTLGRLKATADTRESQGFTVETRTSRIVDRGTKFSAEASVDGHSQVGVLSGAVEVRLPEDEKTHLLRSGDIMAVEPGPNRVIVRIENGDATPAFRYPTISAPSKQDFIDQSNATGTWTTLQAFGALSRLSGPLDALVDGVGQSARDKPEESVFFANDVVGMIQIDLGRIVPISKINCYSWHHNQTLDWNRTRAKQQFELYGSNSASPPSTEGDLAENGWTLIARVNTDQFFGVETPGERPPQQASSITAARGLIGEYRYLLWKVIPTRVHERSQLNSTFFGEIDVFVNEEF